MEYSCINVGETNLAFHFLMVFMIFHGYHITIAG